jgi:hypothetical protein
MRWIVVAVLTVHGLIHVMGFLKAFGYVDLPQLSQPISRGVGLLWLAAGVLVITSVVLLAVQSRSFWIIGLAALTISEAVILSAGRDARAGTLANVILLLAVAQGWFTEGPESFRAQFDRDVAAHRTRLLETPTVTEGDLASLPEPVQRYLRGAGIVGQARIRSYRLRFRGRIRSGPNSRWMPFEATQYSFAAPAARFFLMQARMFGLPVEAFHRLVGGRATMQVKLFGAVPMVDARGDVMDRSETVTLFNDMCLLAPATLVDPGIEWEAVDSRTVRARFTNAGQTISAVLVFGDNGVLTNFISDDRSRSSAAGKTFTRVRFSTPVRDVRAFGSVRLASHGDARWLLPEGEFTYGEFDLREVAYNVDR